MSSSFEDINPGCQSAEEDLRGIMNKREWNYVRKEWSRRTRAKGAAAATYSDILQALRELEKVVQLVLACYSRHKRVFKRVGPMTKDGGLPIFLEEVRGFRLFLEDAFYIHLRPLIPPQVPNEILKLIWEYSQTGPQKFDFGFFSQKSLDQICESIQRRKFLLMTNTLTMNLINAIMMSKMDSRGVTLESLMQGFVKDAEAFKDLTDENHLDDPDFSKFSKIPYVRKPVSCSSVNNYLQSSSSSRFSTKCSSWNPFIPLSKEHDYALAQYMK